ncbi:MAG: hypothetical protein PVI83_05220 [Lysobacterales bacterium]|jgi:hypothetical protein
MGRQLFPLLEMMRLRSGPQDLPASPGITLLLAALYITSGFVAGGVLDEADYGERTLVSVALQFIVAGILLNVRGLQSRLLQTVAALAGTGLLFGLASIGILSWINPEQPQAGLAVSYLGLFLWSLAVDGHIYRNALSIRLGTGVLLAVTVFAINLFVLKALFG